MKEPIATTREGVGPKRSRKSTSCAPPVNGRSGRQLRKEITPAGAGVRSAVVAVLLFLAFETPYFIFFLKYLLASSLSAFPGVKRGCRVAGLALKVAGSLVNGLMPLRALVAAW